MGFTLTQAASDTATGVSAETREGLDARSAVLCPHPNVEDTQRLGDRIAELAAHVHAATYRMLVLLAEFDRREGWGGGFRSCGHWLSWRTGIAPGAAREKVRVARALETLPRISGAMERGELSYTKVRALTRVAAPETEAELLDFARTGTAAHVERLVRAWRKVDRLREAEVEEARRRSRSLSVYTDADGMTVVRGRLEPEAGATLVRALEAAEDRLYRREQRALQRAGQETEETTAGQRRADALGLVAEAALGGAGVDDEEAAPLSGLRAGRHQVVLHVQVEETGVEEAAAEAAPLDGGVLEEGGVRVSAETSRRLACDCAVVRMTHDRRGDILDVGRRTRSVPPSIRRALEARDGGCLFPGCGLKFTEAHHVEHWSDGGPTKLSNLALLCRRHHRAVHEGGYRMELEAGTGEARFYAPAGWLMEPAPAAPRLPADPIGALRRDHEREGITIGPWTPTPDWHGEALDLGLAIDMFHGLRERRRAEKEGEA